MSNYDVRSDLDKKLDRKVYWGVGESGSKSVRADLLKHGKIDKLVDIVLNQSGENLPAFLISTYKGNFICVPVSTSQVDVFTEDGKEVETHVFIKDFNQGVLKEIKEPVYMFVGGKYDNKYMKLKEVERLPEFFGEYNPNLSRERALGGIVHSELLDDQPIIKGYVGPMLDGYKDSHPIIRYETQEVYDMLSEDFEVDEDLMVDYSCIDDKDFCADCLTEMALSRKDAMNQCLDLSENFVEHFHKLYESKFAGDDVSHWIAEMQAWLDKVLSIKLKPHSKKLSLQQKMDWFFTKGSDSETLFLDKEEAATYDDFIDNLAITNDVKSAIEAIIK